MELLPLITVRETQVSFEEELEIPGVSIPRIPPPIPQDDARHLQAIVESLADQEQNCYGIEVYDTVRALVYERS